MPADIQHTLQNLEFSPPPECWQTIERWLDTEYNAEEIKVGQHVYDISVAPPQNAWQAISKELQPKTAIIIPFRKFAIAASVIGLTGLLAWFLFHNTPDGNKLIIPSATAATSLSGSKDNNSPNTPPVVASNNLPIPAKNRRSSSNRRYIASQAINPYVESDDNSFSSNIHYASLGNISAVNSISSPVITAPPIRDGKGKIILDPGVLTPFNDCYVTVTGPNGEQTRISSKFLEILNALDPDIRPQDYFDLIIRNNSLWKQRFKEWRNKLSQQSSFIPDVANFFDIVSLGDLIGDNEK